MIAEKDSAMQEATKELYVMNAELKTALKSAQEEAEKRVAALEAELKALREKKE